MVIYGQPVTKKNSPRIVRVGKRPVLLPSKPYLIWLRASLPQIQSAWRGQQPLDRPVHVSAVFYRARRVGDLNNYLAALADALEAARVVTDDKWIVSWDGSRLANASGTRPRVEVEIELVNQ